ncbi:MAG TPA: hypothetical protein DIU00_21105 [Phycisphaerales bacterium]|nr:hypothetical protein [Phycisphaerales bacterium]
MMVTLSEGAKRSLDDYLRQARTYLRGSRSVDADEIEQNITEHIENELEGEAEPVSYDVLDAVLKKLGSPQQWVPMEELPWWWKIIYRLRSGPEDWRLAYISLALFVAGLLTLPYAPVSIVLILAGFLTSRAAISEAGDIDKIKAQKWLLYPPLIVVYLFVLLALLTWPLALLIPLADVYERDFRESYHYFSNENDYWFVATPAILAGLGLWWSILAIVLLKPRRLLQVVFRPFAEKVRSKWALRLLLIGLVLMILSAGIGVLYYQDFI